MSEGQFANIAISTCSIGVLVTEHEGAQVSQVTVAGAEEHGIRLETIANENHFSDIVLDNPSTNNDNIYDGISIADGDDNTFTDVVATGINHRYVADFSGGIGNVLRLLNSDIGDTGWFLETTLYDNDFGPVDQVPWIMPGVIAVKAGAVPYTALYDMEIVEVLATLGTAPTGSSVIVDVNKNATTIFTTPGDRPTIATSATADSAIPNVTTLAAGDILTVDVDQKDSNDVASDLLVFVRLRRV